MAVNETAFFKLLVEVNDKDAIARMIAEELELKIGTSFEVMKYFGYEYDQINAAAVYDVAEKIVKLKTK